ncbi:MAG: threonine synthase [Firmicutes bacterium HGW-Firmicutes-7]|nr:MAG: threonine synthase [Firmicutes bacterium HGW-Firmicutes-7]
MAQILYNSTRGQENNVEASLAIVKGLACDGGLFVPNTLPKMTTSIQTLCLMNYQDLAYEVMKHFLSDFTEQELRTCIASAYDDKFDTKEIAPLVKKGDAYYLELFHGNTLAFKDMALSILPYLMKTATKKQKIDNDIVILAATSGDTGKAALSGFANVEGTKIIVFYPKDGVSPIQKHQMVTQKGDNTYVIGIEGNFDDAQNGVKEIFNDEELGIEIKAKGYQFSSANSINIGRLIPQIVYYYYAYATLVNNGEIKNGERINVVVPTGNFGNILAAYYAKEMGLPIDHFICASNDNKVLFDFINSGVYDRKREFILTSSPSMDILISSNLERLIYQIAGGDSEVTANLMKMLSKNGEYTITDTMKNGLKDFVGYYASDKETSETIKDVFDKTGYLLDTHTAVGHAAYNKYKNTITDHTKTIVVATASPYKFTRSVMLSIDKAYDKYSDFELIDKMEELSHIKVPEAIEEIRSSEILHKSECAREQMKKEVRKILI